MKNKFKIILLLAFTVGSLNSWAQLTITGEVRPRAEYRDGFKTLRPDNSEPAFFIEQRSRLMVDYQMERLKFKVSIQDVRFWGGTSQIYKADNALFNVNEAWGALKWGKRSWIKAGRQMLNYDNARILGDLRWAQQSRSHDLVKYEFTGKYGTSFHLGAAFNQEFVNGNAEPARLFSNFYSGVNNYKTMQFAWLNNQYESAKYSLLLMNTGYQSADSTVYYRITGGGFYNQSFNNFSLQAEGYYQLGKDPTGTDVNAYMGSLVAGLKMGSTKVELGGDYLSGTKIGSGENQAFAPLFGTNHKFYGLMDFFYVGNGHGNVGLSDIFIKSSFKINETNSLLAHLHYFQSTVDLENTDGTNADAYLGTEIDLVYNIQIQKDVNLKIGLSMLQASESMELIKAGNSDHLNVWGWTMLTFKPTLYKSKLEIIEE